MQRRVPGESDRHGSAGPASTVGIDAASGIELPPDPPVDDASATRLPASALGESPLGGGLPGASFVPPDSSNAQPNRSNAASAARAIRRMLPRSAKVPSRRNFARLRPE